MQFYVFCHYLRQTPSSVLSPVLFTTSDLNLLPLLQLMKLVHTVSGKDIANLMEQWSCRSGVPRFTASYSYVRKKNSIELQLKQEVHRGGTKFVVSEGGFVLREGYDG